MDSLVQDTRGSSIQVIPVEDLIAEQEEGNIQADQVTTDTEIIKLANSIKNSSKNGVGSKLNYSEQAMSTDEVPSNQRARKNSQHHSGARALPKNSSKGKINKKTPSSKGKITLKRSHNTAEKRSKSQSPILSDSSGSQLLGSEQSSESEQSDFSSDNFSVTDSSRESDSDSEMASKHRRRKGSSRRKTHHRKPTLKRSKRAIKRRHKSHRTPRHSKRRR